MKREKGKERKEGKGEREKRRRRRNRGRIHEATLRLFWFIRGTPI